ncbi:MAG TPA: phosphatase [Chromatiales bacterium]|nr:phosphatase [Thiotrichales bacterium]HIP67236.1 phosphatase [Chromatiales bacterium]
MTEQQTAHATKVVNRFRAMIGDTCSQLLDEEHWEELVLLVESAMDAVVLDAEEKICDQLEDMVKKIRSDAEHFDRP